MQLVMDTHTHFRLKVKGEAWKTYKSLIIREKVVHQLDTNDSVQLIIYLDPETSVAEAIRSKYLAENEVCPLDLNIFHFVNANDLEQALLRSEPSLLGKSGEPGFGKPVAWIFQLKVSTTGIDSATEQAILTTHPDELSIKMLADKACLSESRLRALFSEVTGISLYRYMLWNKISDMQQTNHGAWFFCKRCRNGRRIYRQQPFS